MDDYDHEFLKAIAIFLMIFAIVCFGITIPSLNPLCEIEQCVSDQHIEEVEKESDDPYFYIIYEIRDLLDVD